MAKTAFVTGASSDIGRNVALKLAKAGYDIAFTYHTKSDRAESLKKEIRNLKRKCFHYQANLEKRAVPTKMRRTV